MLLPRIFAPVRAAVQTSSGSVIPSLRALDALRAANGSAASPTLSFLRHASHQAQGRANGAKDGPGKRLGAKKSGGEYVVPGNIIFRQRGTAWFPGENCKMGRDHCIFATEAGYVRYYRDPLKHPKRQYIGIVFDKNETLPYPPNAPRRRRLNMISVPRTAEDLALGDQVVVSDLQVGDGTGSSASIRDTPRDNTLRNVVFRKGYAVREANWQIGRVAEKADAQVTKFVPGDRFKAWRKSKTRIAANMEKRRLKNAQKATKSKSKPKRR